MPERFEIYILVYKRRYINTLPFLFFSRLLCGVSPRTHEPLLLKRLHCLPVSNRIQFKLDGCTALDKHNTVFASKRSASCAQAVYFLHLTTPSVTLSAALLIFSFQFNLLFVHISVARQHLHCVVLVLIRNIGDVVVVAAAADDDDDDDDDDIVSSWYLHMELPGLTANMSLELTAYQCRR